MVLLLRLLSKSGIAQVIDASFFFFNVRRSRLRVSSAMWRWSLSSCSCAAISPLFSSVSHPMPLYLHRITVWGHMIRKCLLSSRRSIVSPHSALEHLTIRACISLLPNQYRHTMRLHGNEWCTHFYCPQSIVGIPSCSWGKVCPPHIFSSIQNRRVSHIDHVAMGPQLHPDISHTADHSQAQSHTGRWRPLLLVRGHVIQYTLHPVMRAIIALGSQGDHKRE